MIDDLATVQRLSRRDRTKHTHARDQEIMAAGDAAYASLGLPKKASKRQRDLAGGRVWGALLDEQVGVGKEK